MNATTKEEIALLREGGKRLRRVMDALVQRVVPGVNTLELNSEALKRITEFGDEPAFLGYQPDGATRPFPAAICVSVNDEVVHGIPNEHPKTLQEGDVVTLDMGLVHGGLFTDMAITVPVGDVTSEVTRLIRAAEEALNVAIATARPGNTTGDIGAVVEAVADRYGFSTPHDLGGHGVGRAVHEGPFIPNFGTPGSGTVLEEGMVLAIEPIIIVGKGDIILADDDYTYRTADGSLAAQFEHTVLIGKSKAEILTTIK